MATYLGQSFGEDSEKRWVNRWSATIYNENALFGNSAAPAAIAKATTPTTPPVSPSKRRHRRPLGQSTGRDARKGGDSGWLDEICEWRPCLVVALLAQLPVVKRARRLPQPPPRRSSLRQDGAGEAPLGQDSEKRRECLTRLPRQLTAGQRVPLARGSSAPRPTYRTPPISARTRPRSCLRALLLAVDGLQSIASCRASDSSAPPECRHSSPQPPFSPRRVSQYLARRDMSYLASMPPLTLPRLPVVDRRCAENCGCCGIEAGFLVILPPRHP